MSDYQEPNKNDVYRAKFANLPIIDVVKAMDNVRYEKDTLEAELKEINAEYDFLRHILIPERFEQEGIENLKVADVGRVSLTADIRVSVAADAKEAVFEYFDKIGKGDIVTRQINASTLKAVVRSMIMNAEDVPEDLIKVTPFTRASITKR